MITITPTRAAQMELDFEIDAARLDRLDWQRAIDRNLHVLKDYVHDHQLLIWQPGILKRGRGDTGFHAFDVQLATTSSCTCSRFKLRDRCEHVAFARQLSTAGIMPTTDQPIRAADLNDGEEVAA